MSCAVPLGPGDWLFLGMVFGAVCAYPILRWWWKVGMK